VGSLNIRLPGINLRRLTSDECSQLLTLRKKWSQFGKNTAADLLELIGQGEADGRGSTPSLRIARTIVRSRSDTIVRCDIGRRPVNEICTKACSVDDRGRLYSGISCEEINATAAACAAPAPTPSHALNGMLCPALTCFSIARATSVPGLRRFPSKSTALCVKLDETDSRRALLSRTDPANGAYGTRDLVGSKR
jgi:hypothetical protein